jgi:hypothetical protein
MGVHSPAGWVQRRTQGVVGNAGCTQRLARMKICCQKESLVGLGRREERTERREEH